MNDDAHDPHAARRTRHEHRVATVSAPHGLLAPTGTLWLADCPDGRIPAAPGNRRAAGDAMELPAAPSGGTALDGKPLAGEAILAGIEATPYGPGFRLPGRFRPYGEDRTVRVEGVGAAREHPALRGRGGRATAERRPCDR
ncbi:hypothetical protein ACIA8H_17235 [Streptomyces goshikiensis]|uniref:hypothetical protein n=1 Tax=Streptomyces goshikiensis TaxID=1942 RepID=UPI0037875176